MDDRLLRRSDELDTALVQFGDRLDHDFRYARTDEFLAIVRAIWSGEPVDFSAEHYTVEAATAFSTPTTQPPLYFGGSSDAALPVAVRHCDVYLTWGEPPQFVAEKISRVRRLAAAEGRTLRFGMRVHCITRDTSEQAWSTAQSLLDELDPADIARSQAKFATSESAGQRRMTALHGGRTGSVRECARSWPNRLSRAELTFALGEHHDTDVSLVPADLR